MKRLVTMIVLVILVSVGAFAQDQQVTKEQQIKDSFVDYVLLANAQQKQIAELHEMTNKFIDDIKKVQTIAQLDSVCSVYGIQRPVKEVVDIKKDVKETKK